MKIDLTLKEYFEQLQLMEIQYGMEEDLYPWIYMLLCMVDNKKQELLGESYEAISIRDVHNAKTGEEKLEGITKEIKKYISGRSVPEFIVFDKSLTPKNVSCLGCVEIKVLEYHEVRLKDNNEYELSMLNPTEIRYELDYLKDEKVYIIEKIEENVYNELSKNEFMVSVENENVIITYNNGKTYKLEKGIEYKKSGRKPAKNQVHKAESYSKDIDIFDNSIIPQLRSHIKEYKKVLYTNGLQFCFITLLEDSNENKFQITEIANLKDYYKAYKDNKTVEDDAILEWEKLKLGLMSIDWYKNPIEIPIPSSKVAK